MNRKTFWVLLGGLNILVFGTGQLAALPKCPDSPNCVSSQAERESQRVAGFIYSGPSQQVLSQLQTCVGQLSGAKLESGSDSGLHFTFTTRWIRFVDDVHFELDESNHIVHVRSASRLGYGDFGTNRKRVERIRAQCLPEMTQIAP
jgi:uncharacterized protein (DUF1499 family)